MVNRCVVLPFLCDAVCLFMCLWYGLCLSYVDRFQWVVLCALFCCVLVECVFGVCALFAVCCVAACCFNGLSCVYVLLMVWFRFCCCYGVNAFPVCDCIVCVPSLRCSFLCCVMAFVC